MSPSPGVDAAALAAAVAWAHARYHACDVCAERCGVDRHRGELGRCGLGAEARVYKEYVHLGEERCLVPSHTIYLSGCSFRCVFCSDDGPVRAPLGWGVDIPPEALAARIAQRRGEGARNVNFVGGVPDVNVLYVLRTLQGCPADTHVVWNTNLWTTEEAVEMLDGVVGTWLVDFKFGNDRCARKLSGADGHGQILAARLRQLRAARGDVIVRHLVMPGHVACCTEPALAWLAAELPEAAVNLMTGYQPFQLAGRAGAMGRRPTAAERDAAVEALGRSTSRRRLLDGVEWPAPAAPSSGDGLDPVLAQ